MISAETLHTEWINQVSDSNRKADKILLEKVIRALLLLEGLSESGLSFIFKGGTAVMLMQGELPKRFSIDIDIIIPDRIDLEIFFKKFLTAKNFTRLKIQERKASSNIEKIHYKFFYKPLLQSNISEDNILLDILVESSKYSKVLLVDIDSPLVKQEGAPITVSIPSTDDIFGDKLTAFAPNTIGVPYEKGGFSRNMEIIKQLYDLGNLFGELKDLFNISETFRGIALSELEYRNLPGDINMVLDDVIQTALCLSTRGKVGKGDFEALQKGVSKLRAYIFSELYHIDKAIIHASKVAYIATLIKLKRREIIFFKEPAQVKDWIIDTPMNTKLNKLRKSNSEAFFYWYQIYLLLKK